MILLSCHTCIYDFITHDDTTSVKDYRCARCLQLLRVPPLQSPVWADIRFTISKTMLNILTQKEDG